MTVNLHLKYPEIWQWVKHHKHLEVVSRASGLPVTELRVMATTILVKYPAPDGEVPKGTVHWHQDLSYWDLEPAVAFTSWLAVDPVNAQNGCMEMLPAMHFEKQEHHMLSEGVDNLFFTAKAIPDGVLNISSRRCVELTPGEMSIHGGWTPHASQPNKSKKRRLGIVTNWIPAHVKIKANADGTYGDKVVEWRLPVHPEDPNFPPEVLQKPPPPNKTQFKTPHEDKERMVEL
eukprot:gnl/MRDRNA2_/MRDRNA2_67127_c0_seq1.p1 gnl/MRDRNA2_/MRDRNA2_67127_c0~~gnl/MRDRNA2_/MRDRNA2_67127_c0_seq1.p1  ORF type:complete len:257 (+),score=45.03 gnl/MRDRNA2_/MRDRNA2_67127_c0_seq1:77-772(+)